MYPRTTTGKKTMYRPPITLLVISVGDNIIFDPSGEEIAVADVVMAISVTTAAAGGLKLLALRTIDPPSRLTQVGILNPVNRVTSSTSDHLTTAAAAAREEVMIGSEDYGRPAAAGGVWRPRRGGVKRSVVTRMVKMVLGKGGVGEEVFEGLEGVQV